MKKEYINTDEVPQDRIDDTGVGGSNGHGSAQDDEVRINWWYIAGIALALAAAAAVIALIV